eukprot:Gb_33357 [translate_table: standard]
MQTMACRIRSASRGATSIIKLCYSSSVTSRRHQQMNANATKPFENGTTFLPFFQSILTYKFYSTTASSNVGIQEETYELPGAEGKAENHEFQGQNSQRQDETLRKMREKDEIKLKMEETRDKMCKIIEENDKEMEESLSQMDIRLSSELVRMILSNIDSLHSALRFFQWAKTQRGYKPSSAIYDELVNIAGRSKDFETVQTLLTERIIYRCFNSTKTFLFAIAWHDDPVMLKEVIETIYKLDSFHRRNAYDMLIAALCKDDHVDAASSVLQEMLNRDCAPAPCTFHPFVISYSRNKQMPKVYELFQVMKERDCSPDTTCYNFALRSLCQNEQFSEAAELLGTMVNSPGSKPNSVTYDILILAACKAGKMEDALQLFGRTLEDGLKPLHCTYTSLISGFLQAGEFEKARLFVDRESGNDRAVDLSNHTFLIRSYCKLDKMQEARDTLKQMKAKNLKADAQLCKEVLQKMC